MASRSPVFSAIPHAGQILRNVRRDAKCQGENGNERRRPHFRIE
ncbi:hypothetical protein PspLS_11028 [Pyricularia sp. CBS 133598]|nr:hypothetical protein PspLS_11028 [Pyricularia sp. CBS 133598]